jgi:NACalpha-BTF3-like transcription factor
MTALELAIEELTTTYGDLDLIARSLQVDAAEVAAALEAAEPDSAAGVALRLLAKYNPLVSPAKASKKSL